MRFYHYSIFILILFISGCTENPFFDDNIEIQENRIIRGQVDLGLGTMPLGVYIWLEGLILSDWSDRDGNFIIELPPAETQPGDGLNGIYKLYVYTANYAYRQFDLLLLNGEFEYNTSIIDVDGNFKETIVLTKILDIRTNVIPDIIQITNKDTINFNVQLESLIDSVEVLTHFNQWNTPSSLVFLKLDLPFEKAVLIQGNPATFKEVIIKDIVIWPTTFLFSSGFFDKGIYQVMPYIQIVQEGLPEELLLSIDENIFEIDYHYLNWPIKQETGLLNVVGIGE